MVLKNGLEHVRVVVSGDPCVSRPGFILRAGQVTHAPSPPATVHVRG